MKSVFDWITFLFMDDESGEYCPTHEVKKVKITSKLNSKVIFRGYACPRCERELMDYEKIILRKDDKWIPIEDYIKQVLG